MGLDTDLAKYGAAGVAIAALIFAGWLVKLMIQSRERSDAMHQASLDKLADAIKVNADAIKTNSEVIERGARESAENTRATKEMYKFLKNLNGKLKKTVQEKIEENS